MPEDEAGSPSGHQEHDSTLDGEGRGLIQELQSNRMN